MRRHCGVLPGARVLVACSGGSDSVALARLASATRKDLSLASVGLAHLDHGLRADSPADAELVARLGAALDLPTHVERREIQCHGGTGPEKAARRARYAFLGEVAREHSYDVVATAHTMDDQAETVILRILRGTGLTGLRGIPFRRPVSAGIDVVRPLLLLRRRWLRSQLESSGTPWHDDPTNVDGNVRARVRNEALPLLAEISGRDPVPLLSRLAHNARAEPESLAVAHRFVDVRDGGVELRTGYERLSAGALTRALGEVAGGFRDGHPLSRIEAARLMRRMTGEGAQEDVPGLTIVPGPFGARAVPAGHGRPPAEAVPLPVPGSARVPWADLVVTTHVDRELHRAPGDAEFVDGDALVGGLTVRIAAPGERFVPLGGDAPRRIRSLLARNGVPSVARAHYPVVADENGPVVLPGITLARRVRVTESTRERIAIGTRAR